MQSFSSKIINYPRKNLPDFAVCDVILNIPEYAYLFFQDSGFVNNGRSLILQDS